MDQKIRFYLDEHVSPAVAAGLRRRGVEALTVQESNMTGKQDIELLVFALQENYVIVTQDADFLRLHAEGMEHNGIAYAPQQTSVGVLLRGLMLVVQVLDASEMKNHIEFLPLD